MANIKNKCKDFHKIALALIHTPRARAHTHAHIVNNPCPRGDVRVLSGSVRKILIKREKSITTLKLKTKNIHFLVQIVFASTLLTFS